MDEDFKQILEKAIKWDATIHIAFYQLSDPPGGLFRYQYLELISEAYHCFMNNCPRASVIVAGEALLRAIFDRIVFLLPKIANISYRSRSKKTTVLELMNKKGNKYDNLVDALTFDEAIGILRKSQVYDQSLIERMYDVKALRNMVTHKGYAFIDNWVPNPPSKSKEHSLELSISIENQQPASPEAYRMHNERNDKWIYFNCREHNCTLKALDYRLKLAAIQYYLVQDIIKDFI